MANTIKPKRSYTASATPTLAAGELAIQAADKKVLIGNSTGTGNILIASLNGSDITGTVASATSATTATNLAGGGAGQLPYQSGSGTTAMLAAGTSGQILRSNGTAAPSWETQGLFSSGRLTLESGVPVSTTDQTAKTTIFFTPYNGDKISLYDGSSWATYTFTERSLLLSGLTANRNYDVFLYVSSGTLNLESLVWNSSSDSNTRTTGLVLTSGGVYTKSGDATKRYLGTFRTTGTTGQTEDSASKRFVWNCYNRVKKTMSSTIFSGTIASWSGASREWNGGASVNRIGFVVGNIEDALIVNGSLGATTVTATSTVQAGFAVNSTTSFFGSSYTDSQIAGFTTRVSTHLGMPGLGYNYITAVQYASANAAWYSVYGSAVLGM